MKRILKRFQTTSLVGMATAAILVGCQGTRPATSEEIALAKRLNEAQAARNAAVRIVFDPATDYLEADAAGELVRVYAIPAAWSVPHQMQAGRANLAHRRVDPAVCQHYRQSRLDPAIGSISGHDGTPCMLTTHDAPVGRPVRITMASAPVDQVGVRVWRTDLRIARDGGTIATIATFSPRPRNHPQQAAALAAVLGLKRRSETQGQLAGLAELQPALSASSGVTADAQGNDLASLLEGKAQPGLRPDLLNPAVIAKNADHLLDRFARELTRGSGPGTIRLEQVAAILARLPEQEWRAKAPQILAALEARPTDAPLNTLLPRLGKLGREAIPALGAIAARHEAVGRGSPFALSQAACQIGQSAATVLGPKLLRDWERANRFVYRSVRHSATLRFEGGRHKACIERAKRRGPPESLAFEPCWQKSSLNADGRMVYLALLRLGLRDQADPMAKHHQAERFSQQASGLSPRSDASVCSGTLLY